MAVYRRRNYAASAKESYNRVRVSLYRFGCFRGFDAAAEELHVQRFANVA
jgi:hypothetical protein